MKKLIGDSCVLRSIAGHVSLSILRQGHGKSSGQN